MFIVLFLFQVVVVGWEKHRTVRSGLHSSEIRIFTCEDYDSQMGPERFHGPPGQNPSRPHVPNGDGGERRLGRV